MDTQVLGPGAFQEVDLASAFSSVAAWSQAVLSSSDHAELMTLALKHAILKRDVGHLIVQTCGLCFHVRKHLVMDQAVNSPDLQPSDYYRFS